MATRDGVEGVAASTRRACAASPQPAPPATNQTSHQHDSAEPRPGGFCGYDLVPQRQQPGSFHPDSSHPSDRRAGGLRSPPCRCAEQEGPRSGSPTPGAQRRAAPAAPPRPRTAGTPLPHPRVTGTVAVRVAMAAACNSAARLRPRRAAAYRRSNRAARARADATKARHRRPTPRPPAAMITELAARQRVDDGRAEPTHPAWPTVRSGGGLIREQMPRHHRIQPPSCGCHGGRQRRPPYEPEQQCAAPPGHRPPDKVALPVDP